MIKKGNVIELDGERMLVVALKTIGKRDFCLASIIAKNIEFRVFLVRVKKGKPQISQYSAKKRDFTTILNTLLEVK